MLVSESFFVQDWSIIRVYPDESIICLHVQNDYLCVQLYMKGQTKHQLWAEISQIESTCQENKKSQSYKLLFDAILQKLEGRPIVFLVDEIYDKDLIDISEENIRLVLVMNPKSDEKRSLMLDFSHLPFLSSQPISPYL